MVISLYIRQEQNQQLNKKADELGISPYNLVQQLINTYLNDPSILKTVIRMKILQVTPKNTVILSN